MQRHRAAAVLVCLTAALCAPALADAKLPRPRTTGSSQADRSRA